MRYYWLRDKIAQATFNIKWESAKQNSADYFTKHFTSKYNNRDTRKKYVLDATPSSPARVCYYSTYVTAKNSAHICAHQTLQDTYGTVLLDNHK